MKLVDQFVLGRWEEILNTIPDESFNLIYFDPPYGCSYKSNIPGDKKWNKTGKSTKFNKHILGDDGQSIDWESLASQCFRLLKNNSFLFIHGDVEHIVMRHAQRFEDAGFIYKGTVAWRKLFSVGGDLKGAMKRSWEPILYFAKGKVEFNPITVKRNGADVLRKRIEEIGPDWEFKLSDKEKVGFPTQKPLALARQIIQLTTKEGDLICDPFAGSGTSGLAARQTNRHFFTIEADKEYYNKFKYRPSQLKQLLLFDL